MILLNLIKIKQGAPFAQNKHFIFRQINSFWGKKVHEEKIEKKVTKTWRLSLRSNAHIHQSSVYSDFDHYNDDTESWKYHVFIAWYYGFDAMCLLFSTLYYLIKAYRTGNQTLPILRDFREFNLFLSFQSQRRKNVSAFCNIQWQWNDRIHFQNSTKRYGLIVWKMLSEKKIFRNNFVDKFLVWCLCVKLTTIQIWRLKNKFPLTCSLSIQKVIRTLTFRNREKFDN